MVKLLQGGAYAKTGGINDKLCVGKQIRESQKSRISEGIFTFIEEGFEAIGPSQRLISSGGSRKKMEGLEKLVVVG